MPTVTKVYTPANIIQGPADIFVDVAAPISAVPPVQGTNTLTIDTSGQPTDTGTAGFHVGISEGPIVLSVTPKFDEIRADTFAAAIDAAFISAETEIDIVVKESILQNLAKFFTSPLGTYSNLLIGATNPAADFLQIGSPRSAAATLRTLLLTSPRRDATTKFWYVLAYRAALKSALAMALDRKKETTYKLKFWCIADTSRVASDQVLQFVKGL